MGKRSFFDRPPGLTVAEIVALTGAEAGQAAPMSLLITGVAPVDLAGPVDLTFVEGNKFADAQAGSAKITASNSSMPRFDSSVHVACPFLVSLRVTPFTAVPT